ncbi:MAG: hypothetical protein ACREFZ_07020 [Acetobacteraceae bacterium]
MDRPELLSRLLFIASGWGISPGGRCISSSPRPRGYAEARRKNIVAQAQRSPAALREQTTAITPDGLPVHSFRILLADLASLARNTIVTAITPNYPITVLTKPTPIQHMASPFWASACSE